jgi:hypothetical protein
MGVEDQKEEREVLESIFPEEITGLRSGAHKYASTNPSADISETEFRISIQLEVTNDEGDDAEPRMISLSTPDQSRTC